MIEERREEIERSIERFKSYRKCRVDFYLKWDGVIPDDQLLPEIKKDIEWAEESIMKLREQLPPPMSQRQLRALEEIPKAWAEVTGKKVGKEGTSSNSVRNLLDDAIKREIDKAHEEALREALHRDLWARFDKPKEEAREEHGTPVWKVDKDSPVGGIFIDKDNVAHVKGMIETSRMVIVEAPRRTGRTFRNWLCNYFK